MRREKEMHVSITFHNMGKRILTIKPFAVLFHDNHCAHMLFADHYNLLHNYRYNNVCERHAYLV